MRQSGSINFAISENARGGWTGVLACPMPGCNATATVTSKEKTGPYSGSCTTGHQMVAPAVRADW